jgi:hypothetical protein
MGESQLSKKLFFKAGGKPRGRMLLLFLKQEEYEKKSFSAACKLAGTPGIYISMGKLWRDIHDKMEDEKVDDSKFYWIGGTGVGFWSRDPSLKGKIAGNVTLLEGPTALFHLTMTLDLLIPTGKYKYVYLDSVNVLADKNPKKNVEKFLQLLAKKLKARGMAGIYVCVDEGEAKKLLSALSTLCDATLTAKEI